MIPLYRFPQEIDYHLAEWADAPLLCRRERPVAMPVVPDTWTTPEDLEKRIICTKCLQVYKAGEVEAALARRPCPQCGGRGQIPLLRQQCTLCQGFGYVTSA